MPDSNIKKPIKKPAERMRLTIRSLHKLKFNEHGLIPAIIQDARTKEVLMLAYMNEASLKETLKRGLTCFWSRSRQEYWIKGMTSGHLQYVKEVRHDCDNDTLLILVDQVGAACHTMEKSCFYRTIPLPKRRQKDATPTASKKNNQTKDIKKPPRSQRVPQQ